MIRSVQGSGLRFTFSEAMNLELPDLLWYSEENVRLINSEHQKTEDPDAE